MSGSSRGGHSGYRGRRYTSSLTDAEVNRWLAELLQAYNDRDIHAINRHLRVLRDALELDDGDSISTLFGGSVSRHTAVDGLSDVDVLVMINASSFRDQSPAAVIRSMAQRIKQRLPMTKVTTGSLAVTVRYSDGTPIQVLPAMRTSSGVRIADPDTGRWSNVTHPARFARQLTRVNQACNGQVVPTVKLAKGITSRAIRSNRDSITGYHLEALAIRAFRNYNGPYDLKSMVRRYLSSASRNVTRRIGDPTRQSPYIDDYMGSDGSSRRQRASDFFSRELRRFNACRTKTDFERFFGV